MLHIYTYEIKINIKLLDAGGKAAVMTGEDNEVDLISSV